MRVIELFAKKALEASVRIGLPQDLACVSEAVERPEFAAAVGLAIMAAEDQAYMATPGKPQKKAKKAKKQGPGLFKKIFSKF